MSRRLSTMWNQDIEELAINCASSSIHSCFLLLLKNIREPVSKKVLALPDNENSFKQLQYTLRSAWLFVSLSNIPATYALSVRPSLEKIFPSSWAEWLLHQLCLPCQKPFDTEETFISWVHMAYDELQVSLLTAQACKNAPSLTTISPLSLSMI